MNTFFGKNIIRSLILLFVRFSVIFAILWKFSPPFTSYEEEKISQKVLQNICDSDPYKKVQLKEKVPNLEEYNTKASLIPRNDITQTYEVFRWKCKYTFNGKKEGTIFQEDKELSLKLNDYCATKFDSKKLTQSHYHHYNEADSWYCVNPNF